MIAGFFKLPQREQPHNVRTKLEEKEKEDISSTGRVSLSLSLSLRVYVLAALAKSSQLKACIDVRIMLLVETGILISRRATVGQNFVGR